MAKVKGAIEVDVERCKGCQLCEVACPTHVILMSHEVNAKGYHYCYMDKPDACIACTSCAAVCPDSVIEVYKLKLA